MSDSHGLLDSCIPGTPYHYIRMYDDWGLADAVTMLRELAAGQVPFDFSVTLNPDIVCTWAEIPIDALEQ